jgi:signal transduction histidine kinase/FixJ family two-component response regulator
MSEIFQSSPRWLNLIHRPLWLLIVALFIAFVAGHASHSWGLPGRLFLAVYVGCALWLEQQAQKLDGAQPVNSLALRLSALACGLSHLLVGFGYVVLNNHEPTALIILTLMTLFSLAATLSLNPRPLLWIPNAAATAITCLSVISLPNWAPIQTLAATTLIGLAIQGNQLRDLHLRRVAHNKQQAANNELIEQLEAERALSDKLRFIAEDASRAKTRFMAAASHDLRQPLTALALYAESLNQVARGTTTKELAHHIDTSVGHLEKLFNALLDLSKLDAGVVQADFQRFAIQELMPRIDKDLRESALRKGLRFECLGPDIWIDSDPILFERIIRNLAENAVRYTKTGEVRIEWREAAGGQIVIDISDTGVGIAESERDKIFDEYYQIEKPGRDRSAGLGIGLAIVRRLSDLLKFDIVLQSRLNVGSVFRLIGKTVPRPNIAPFDIPIAAPGSELSLKGLRLLVLDDDPDIRQAAQFVFELEQAQVQVAANHAQAMQAFAGEGPELVIADFRLGDGESGLDVLKALRQRQPSLKAMIITGDTGPEPLNQVLGSGYRIVHKPMSGAQLVAHVRALMGAGANSGMGSDSSSSTALSAQSKRARYVV